jgi:hypothetical protein
MQLYTKAFFGRLLSFLSCFQLVLPVAANPLQKSLFQPRALRGNPDEPCSGAVLDDNVA